MFSTRFLPGVGTGSGGVSGSGVGCEGLGKDGGDQLRPAGQRLFVTFSGMVTSL